MSRIGLVVNAGRVPPQDTIQDPDLLEVMCIGAKLANNFNHETGFHLPRRPFQIGLATAESEIVSMNDALQVAQSMSKNT